VTVVVDEPVVVAVAGQVNVKVVGTRALVEAIAVTAPATTDAVGPSPRWCRGLGRQSAQVA